MDISFCLFIYFLEDGAPVSSVFVSFWQHSSAWISIHCLFRPQTRSAFNQPLAKNAFPGLCSSMSPTFSWQPMRREQIVHVSLHLSRPHRTNAAWSTSRSASLDWSAQGTFQKSGPTLISTVLPSLVSPPTELQSQSRSANLLKHSRRKPGLLLCHFLAGFPRRWVGDSFRAAHTTVTNLYQ